MIKCSKCLADKDETEFYYKANGVLRDHICKRCHASYALNNRRRYAAEGRCYCGREREDEKYKWCTKCRNASCQRDRRAYQKKFRRSGERASIQIRQWNVRGKYGLSRDDLQGLYDRQGGKCAICGTEKPMYGRNGLFVDHCHTSNRVRGLLCHTCNLFLGQAKDSPVLLQAAITYLATT